MFKKRDINVGEKHQLSVSPKTWTRDLADSPGMFLDQESNWWPQALQDNAQPTKPHQSGHTMLLVCLGTITWAYLLDSSLETLT